MKTENNITNRILWDFSGYHENPTVFYCLLSVLFMGGYKETMAYYQNMTVV